MKEKLSLDTSMYSRTLPNAPDSLPKFRIPSINEFTTKKIPRRAPNSLHNFLNPSTNESPKNFKGKNPENE